MKYKPDPLVQEILGGRPGTPKKARKLSPKEKVEDFIVQTSDVYFASLVKELVGSKQVEKLVPLFESELRKLVKKVFI